MPPGGETSRYSGRFGENVLRHGSHEWLPYSKDEVLLECSNNNLSNYLRNPITFSCDDWMLKRSVCLCAAL